MSSVSVKHSVFLGVPALAVVGLMFGATPAASDGHSADAPRVVRGPLRSSAESLHVWIDSVRRQHNVPAMGAIVFRADTVLARGVAGTRRSNAPAQVEERDRFQLGANT